MRKIICALTLCVASLSMMAQQGKDGAGVVNAAGTIVNSYTTLSADAPAGSLTISVGSVVSLNAGDLIMIVQMQGASVNSYHGGGTPPWFDPNSAQPQDTSYGRVTAYNGAGNNEYAEINSIAGTTLTLNCALNNAYSTAGKTQIVRVPRYTSLSIGAAGVITCPHWDRTLGYGGVIAIEVHGNTTIASGGRIDATGLGFRGGAFWFKSASNPGGSQWGCLYTNEGSNKGESIAGDTNVYAGMASKFGKGSIANGGGGGNNINGGGGGGANAGTLSAWTSKGTSDPTYNGAWALETPSMVGATSSGGGRGGYTFSSSGSNPNSTAPGAGAWGGDNRRVQGGLGGRPLNYSAGQLYAGGGGGAGDGENFYQGYGGDGGGIISILSYGTVSGAGQIVSNGAAGGNSLSGITRPGDGTNVSGRDGAGGGGGGGAILVKSIGAVTGITVNANGGVGGNNAMDNHGGLTAQAYGPGGGGGGGYIGLPTGTAITTGVTGGNNGIVQYVGGVNNCSIDNNFPPNGSTRGGAGSAASNTTSYSIATNGATICAGTTAILTASINGTAPNPVTINWYTAAVGGTPIATGASYTTAVLGTTTTYYVGTCPGIYREPVVVTVTSAPAAPTATSPVSYCLNATASQLTATAGGGNTLLWWGTASSGGTSSGTAPTPSTAAVGSTTYYVSQTNGSCEGPRQSIVVDILNLPAQPAVTSPVDYCLNATASQLSATAGGGNSLLWWGTASSGGSSSGTATTPSTSAVGSTTYYVSQTNGTCESSRSPIVVNVNALPSPPAVADTISYCQNDAASPLTPSGAGINWYTTATGGAPIATPTPNTSTVGTTTYYVSQIQSGCESNRDSIKVVVNTSFPAPTVTNATYCLGAVATDLSGNASGTGTLNWWGTAASGGTSSTTAPTPSTAAAGTTSYYVSQGSATCESNRVQIDVIVNALPSPPSVTTPVDYCLNATPSQLSATAGGGSTLLWWGTDATGGTSSGTAPTPSTATAGSTTYYVSQNDGSCESAREPIVVNINPLPSPPAVADTISYCQNEPSSPLTPSGAGINWYTTATGGAPVATPTPNTSAVGVTTYYVSQTQGGCESSRDSIKVVVNTSFLPPSVTNASYCIGDVAADLSANASGTATLNWYTASSGGTGTTTAPTPSTSTAGTTTWYVSQGSATCESSRAQLDVVVNAIPNVPSVTSPVDYCENAIASQLNATAGGGNSLLWWGTAATGGTSSGTANTPSTTTVGTMAYYVSETDGTCESPRAAITVNVNAIPAPPTVADTISYCQNEAANQLTPGGAGINWYTVSTGGTPMTAPTPNTGTVGTTTYYVSQTQNGCESNRDSIKVVVNTSFLPPSVSNVAYCEGAVASDLSTSASGTATLNWYTTSTGGTGSTTAPTPSTASAGTISYFVSQGSATCESNRAQIDVTVNALPVTPTGTDVTYCINETPVPLTASGTATLNWYTTSTGGTGSTTAPTPSTSTVGTVSYYVSQTDANGCESARDNVQVDVINLQNAPLATNTDYCAGATASPLTASGTTTLNWWGTAATGGISSATAPTPSTATTGATTYYVSQGTGACESPRTAIIVTVSALPTVSFTPINSVVCIPACVNFTATTSAGATVAWSFGDGGTGTNANETHCYTSAGNYDVSVVATSTQGCTNTSTVTSAVLVNAGANAQFTVSPGTTVTPDTPIDFAGTSVTGQTYSWNFADPSSGTLNTSALSNPSHTYAEEGIYCVQLLAVSATCSDTQQVCIEVIKEANVTIPNIITPNGDGLNELFTVTASGIKSLEASIYDRWGLKLYSWSGIAGGWDGRGKGGTTVSNGVYFYIITTNDFKGEAKDYSGYVQVISAE